MEMTRRRFVRAVAGAAAALCATGGEGVPPLRREAILASLCQASMHSSRPKNKGKMPSSRKSKGGTPSPRCLGKYPGEIVPTGDIFKQSKWSG
jgi:hypothetical protein